MIGRKNRFQSTLPRRKWLDGVNMTTGALLFQSTLPRRKWQIPNVHMNTTALFQSTLPRRKWHYQGGMLPTGRLYFNPHFREGSDADVFSIFSGDNAFQSTLPRRKWLWYTVAGPWNGNFNPHFREGSDPEKDVPAGVWNISIHTSAKEVTMQQVLKRE